jgi:hypothetical protein
VETFGNILSQFLPLQVWSWDLGPESEAFYNQSGIVRLGDLTLLSTWGSSIDGLVEQKSQAQWILPYLAGTNNFKIDAKAYVFRDSSLYIPAHQLRIHLRCTLCSGVIISFSPEALVPVAAAIAGPAFDSLAFLAVLEQPGILGRRSDERRHHPVGRKLGRRACPGRLAIPRDQGVVFDDAQRPPRKIALRIGRHDPTGLAIHDQLPGRIARHRNCRNAERHTVEQRSAAGNIA